jgi:hypothetical protein
MRILGSAVFHGGASTLVNDEKEPWRWWSYVKTLLRITKSAAVEGGATMGK